VLGEDSVTTAAVAMGVARTQALHRRVFVGDLLGEGSPLRGDAAAGEYGLSDMIRYGVSLGRAAMVHPDSPNLFAVSGGADPVFDEEVLASPSWRSLSDQVHRAGALLLVAVSTRLPGVEHAVRQLDGVLLVDDARLPGVGIRSLGEVRTGATIRTPVIPAPVVEERPTAGARRWMVIGVTAVLALAAVSLLVPSVRDRVLPMAGITPARTSDPTSQSGSLPPVPPPTPRVTSDAAWSVELLFTNSEEDALARATQLADSVPATTFSAPVIGADSTTWQRVVCCAFSDSLSAENFLASLRSRGFVAAGAGVVLHTPFAFVLDSAQDGALAAIRVTAYRSRGIPAYGLRDTLGMWRVYAGAFGSESEGTLLRQRMDSLNIQSTLITRVGSER
jgi:hypothetical protein